MNPSTLDGVFCHYRLRLVACQGLQATPQSHQKSGLYNPLLF
jgi:hypothetical protein